jgi:putative ABC transport system substrate-binding protein
MIDGRWRNTPGSGTDRTARRRIRSLGAGVLTLIAFAMPVAGTAQPARPVYRIGYLSGSSLAANKPFLEQLQQGLRERGYTEGQNVLVEYRWAGGNQERLPELAADLVRLNVDLIVAHASTAALAAHRATRTIPIVMVAVGDPIRLGLAASLARPGGNVTGTASYLPELSGKPLEILREIVPGVRRVAILWNPANPLHVGALKDLEAPSSSLGIQLQSLKIVTPEDFEGAFRLAATEQAAAAWVLGDPTLSIHWTRIAALALKVRLPTLFQTSPGVDAGGLISYGPDLLIMYRRAAHHVDRILKGSKPRDLPVEQPTKFELVINQATAKMLGLTIPQSLLIRADRIIE